MNKNQICGKISISFFASMIFVCLIILNSSEIFAQEQNSDAIGVRIVPNPNHYSIYRWYESQGFSGSPQSLTVDGYEALRDGRTVYVNAANVDTYAKVIYTNIYLISYNQDYNVKTVDILGQLISHWKFNDNLPLETSTCSISSLKCEQDSDCTSNQFCSNSDTCALKEPKNCAVDEDCPASFFCGSLKAKIIRDLKRIGKLEEIKEALASYKKINGRYPLLSAGTYLSGKSVSLWPSWSDILIPTLAIKQALVDPINSLGACPGFNSKTCWDDANKKFVYDPAGAYLKLPKDSYALVYGTNNTGSDYNLCAVLETHAGSNYTFSPNDPIASACVTETGILASGNSSNSVPVITSLALKGISGNEYNGFVQAVDPDGDSLTWSLQPLAGSWPNWQGAPPIIKDTSNINQKKIFATRAGNAGLYPIGITIADSNGASVSTTTRIEISSLSSAAQAEDYTYHLDPTVPFNYNFYVSGGGNVPSSAIILVSGPNILQMPGITRTASAEGLNRQKINYQGVISNSQKFTDDLESHYRVQVTNASGNPVTDDFIIKIIVDKPVLDFNCANQSRLNYAYKCSLGSTVQGNHILTYSITSPMPAGLSLSAAVNNQNLVYLQGNTVAARVNQEVKIKAVNEYGTATEKSFILDVNTYCGDGVIEKPNTEGRGGVRNDGQEACDGSSQIATSSVASNKDNQYACNTTSIASTPYPITGSNYCIFKSPLAGGGFCGDTYCQLDHEKICFPGDSDPKCCNFDCDPNYFSTDPTLSEGQEVALDCNNGLYCDPGYECTSSGVCQKKCWAKSEKTHEVMIRGGDAIKANTNYRTKVDGWKTYNYGGLTLSGFIDGVNVKTCTQSDNSPQLSGVLGCSIIRLDNPECTGGTVVCPVGSNTSTILASRDGGKCKSKGSDWSDRLNYTCARVADVSRCYQDDCRTTDSAFLDGIMNENGLCVKKPPIRYCDDEADCLTGEECQNAVKACTQKAGVSPQTTTCVGIIGACMTTTDPPCSVFPVEQACNYQSYCEWKVTQQGTCVADKN